MNDPTYTFSPQYFCDNMKDYKTEMFVKLLLYTLTTLSVSAVARTQISMLSMTFFKDLIDSESVI